jgi:membrane protein required for colicin V production
MTPIDYILLAVVGISALLALMRGIVAEVMSLVVWAVALWCSVSFSGLFAEQFLSSINVAGLRLGTAYLVIFLGVLVLGGVLTWLIRRVIAKTGMSSTDRLLGCLFGATRGLLLVFSAVFFAGFTQIPKQPFWQESALIPHVGTLAQGLSHYLPSSVSQYLNFPKFAEPIEANELAKPIKASESAEQTEANKLPPAAPNR